MNSKYGFNINGIVNINKEKGFTSHDVVAKLRGILKIKKIGHTGTLDPMATGVLPVCIGNATKVCDLIMEKKKAYIARVKLGIRTDTLDITGEVTETDCDIENKKTEILNNLQDVMDSFKGEIEQIPPMYSAIKVDGKKLYELAREGKEIERKARKVTIYDIKVSDIDVSNAEFSLYVECSKGTYIRTLIDDLGVKCNTFAVMTELKRVKSGSFLIEDSLTLKEVEESVKKVLDNKASEKVDFSEEKLTEEINKLGIFMPVENVFIELKKVCVKKEFEKVLLNGNKLKFDMIFMEDEAVNIHEKLEEKMQVRVADYSGEFKAIYEVKKNELKPVKMFL
ncbi:MAG: tRNA pseudouridine(55) synthase TruB [Lachnospiraceae bacterium]|nr:tRNA pseudouridine(55) synthase TruB [Lachnospiraceae bacterium]